MKWLAALLGGVFLLYPLLVYWGIQRFEPRFVGVIALLFYALRLLIQTKDTFARIMLIGGLFIAVVLMWFLNNALLLLLMPAIVNGIMAVIFIYHMLVPPTIPAKFAKKARGSLTPRDITYTNILSRIWVAFFCINGSVAVFTALYTSREIWALYNGLIAYILIGALVAGEYLYRYFIFHRRDS